MIDYYSGGTDEDGNPSFNVNVRPALDSSSAFVDRIREGFSWFVEKIKLN